jgi:hypothetical protein
MRPDLRPLRDEPRRRRRAGARPGAVAQGAAIVLTIVLAVVWSRGGDVPRLPAAVGQPAPPPALTGAAPAPPGPADTAPEPADTAPDPADTAPAPAGGDRAPKRSARARRGRRPAARVPAAKPSHPAPPAVAQPDVAAPPHGTAQPPAVSQPPATSAPPPAPRGPAPSGSVRGEFAFE